MHNVTWHDSTSMSQHDLPPINRMYISGKKTRTILLCLYVKSKRNVKKTTSKCYEVKVWKCISFLNVFQLWHDVARACGHGAGLKERERHCFLSGRWITAQICWPGNFHLTSWHSIFLSSIATSCILIFHSLLHFSLLLFNHFVICVIRNASVHLRCRYVWFWNKHKWQ